MDGSAAAEPERVVMRWDSTASASTRGGVGVEEMLCDGGGDRVEAERFLLAVDDLRRLAPPSAGVVGSPRQTSSAGGSNASNAVQVAMARLEDEFRQLLTSRAFDLEIEELADLISLSISSDRTNSSDVARTVAGDDDDSVSSSVLAYTKIAPARRRRQSRR